MLHRCVGILLLAGMGASTTIHRGVWLAAKDGPATILEGAMALATFILGCLGVLLLMHGRKLRDEWTRAIGASGHDDAAERNAKATCWWSIDAYMPPVTGEHAPGR